MLSFDPYTITFDGSVRIRVEIKACTMVMNSVKVGGCVRVIYTFLTRKHTMTNKSVPTELFLYSHVEGCAHTRWEKKGWT